MQPRPHQRQAVDEIHGSIAFGSEKLIADLPTSFGKSLVLSLLAQELPGKIGILVTFTPLIDQIAEHLDEIGVEYSIIKAGMEDRFYPDRRIQLIMKQTYHARKDKLDLKVDYLLKDEVHVEWFGQKRMDEVFEALGKPILIGVSGTPFDSKGYRLKGSDDLIRTKSIRELTEEGYLTPVKYFIPKWAEEVDYSELTIKGNDYSEGDIDSIVLEQEHMDSAVESMMKMGIDKKKTIVFCNSIEHAELVADNLRAQNVKAYAYHSKQDKLLSKCIVNSFRSNDPIKHQAGSLTEEAKWIDCQVICAVNRISIGFDVPDIQMGVMMRKMAVRSLFYQQIGRLIRLFEGKKYAELLDLANNTATFGFHDEPYSPPEYGDKEALKAENDRLAAPVMTLITQEEPTHVTRQLVLDKIQELEHKKKDLPSLTVKDLIAIYDTTVKPVEIIAIGYEMNRRKTGTGYNQSKVEWAAGPWITMIEKYPQYRNRIIKSLKTMLKNKVAKGAKPAGIHYSAEWLEEQTPYRDYTAPDHTEPTQEIINNYNNYEYDIDEDDIPF